MMDPRLMAMMDPGYNDDPRAQAIDKMYKKPRRDIQTKDEFPPVARDPQMMFPGMKGEDDLDAFERQNNLDSTRDRLKAPPRRTIGDMMGMPYGGQGTPDEVAEADATSKMSDEELLAQVQRQMAPPGASTNIDDDATNQANWPDTAEEFTKKFGREPTTDAEVEFYYGDAVEDDRAMEPERR
jgi:hypothetical protein